ncbi:hypothetical protein B296_00024692 [Ensete ventricosum]|uniref:Peptidase A2 domain-containing protein n=1 Tax=Ensete ventricosum TaxID=4639 RepID=A0A426XWV6_ENSVE|nr:hypothetical protein B296_00024692 [Ensete ventricosum]
MERGEQTVPRTPNVSLNFTRTEIFLQIREKGLLKTPNPLRSRAEDRDRRRYYRFHHDYGHNTKECYNLKNQIKDLIHRNHLDRYIRKPHKTSLRPKGPVEWHINVIVGGPAVGGVSSSSGYPDHDDALVVTARIANACLRRIMIDIGSSTDILYLDAFHKLGMTNRNLTPMTSTLTGFIGNAITPVRVATLPITFGD